MPVGCRFPTVGKANPAEFHLLIVHLLHGRVRSRTRGLKMGRLCRCLFYALSMSILLVVLPQSARAGGPHYVAGVSYFDPGTKGLPLTWAGGAINYYTDQGNLSPILPGPTADAFVADAFSQWISISTAAVSATRAGQLAEDVSGPNVTVSGGVITMPGDILPSAVNTPVGIVYDLDGTVTDALLGQGAGGSGLCFTNAVFGGIDNLSTAANFLHALVIINGNCAQTSGQLPDVEYRLVRVLGRVLGLDWSQVNVNVFTRNPVPTPADYAGLTILHAADPINCVPISLCYANAFQSKMDDQAALSRMYPVTTQNQASFPGKQLFFENTIRIHGTVYFVDAGGLPAQPMQGANVVARWIDPGTGQPSRTYAAASVSGFLFRGNAGNSASGFNDSTGQPYFSPGGRRTGKRLRRVGKQSLPEFLRHRSTGLRIAIAGGGGQQSGGYRWPEFPAGGRASYRFSRASAPGSRGQRWVPIDSLAHGPPSTGCHSGRNHHYQKPHASYRVLVAGIGRVRRQRSGDPPAS
jgi:hypothetical protein